MDAWVRIREWHMSTTHTNPLVTSHQHFIAGALPDWLIKASTAQRRAYAFSARNELDAVRELAQATQGMQNPLDFARPLLTRAIKLRFGLDVDVDNTELVVWEPGSFIRNTHRRSLLEAALANFSADEATEGVLGYSAILPKGALYLKAGNGTIIDGLPLIGWTYDQHQALAIKPHHFAALCRDLDLGAQYEVHFRQVYNPKALYPGDQPGPGVDDRVTKAILYRFSCSLECDARVARLRNHIGDPELAALLQVASLATQPEWHGRKVVCHELRLLRTNLHGGYLLRGAMLFRREGFEACIVYLPGHPEHPLKVYPHIDTFTDALRPQLGKVGFSRYIQRFISHAEVAQFHTRLGRTLFPEPAFHIRPVIGVFDPTADIGLHAHPQPLQAHLLHYTHVTRKIWYDGITLVVATGDVDRQAREALVKHYLQSGLSLLTVASLFVPGAGELLAAIGAGQLLNEIFIGIDDWQHGQTAQALEHLLSVGENVALLAGGAAALHIGSSAFIEEMVPVLDGAGRKRLFYPKMERLRSPVEVPPTARSNALGQYEVDGKLYARIDGQLYQQRFNRAANCWEIVPPPAAPQCHAALRHNEAGAWAHAHETAVQWPADTVIGRWGPATDGLNKKQLDFARRVSGLNENNLRRLHVYNQPMPGLLEDTLARQALANELRRAANAQAQIAARYQLLQGVEHDEAQWLRRDFPGLPKAVASDITRQATAAELMAMANTRRVPLRLAEQARLQLREVRLARACEALAGDEFASADRDKLALGLLERLEGWGNGVRVELRDTTLGGPLLASAGSNDALEVKYVVRSPSGYVPYDQQGEALYGSTDLFTCLLRALPDSERQALRLNIFDTAQLRSRLTELALVDRPRVARLLGVRTSNPLFRAPSRVNGAIGYPLSGRGTGAHSFQQRLANLFPGLGANQLAILQLSLVNPGESLGHAILRLETEWRVLDAALEEWIGVVPAVPVTNDGREARRELATRIRRAWRRDAEMLDEDGPYYNLDLGGHPPGSLPVITANFPHVRGLYLDELGLDSVPQLFLDRFPNLRTLDLSSNRLTALPDTLSSFPSLTSLFLSENALLDAPGLLAPVRNLARLRTLDLQSNELTNTAALFTDIAQLNRLEVLIFADNGLAPTAADFRILADLPNLESLDLSANLLILDAERVEALAQCTQLRQLALTGNPLAIPPDVSQMVDLEVLQLNQCSLSEWPPGLSGLMTRPNPRLREIQLRENQISEFPAMADSTFIALRNAEPVADQRRIVVLDNPFSQQSADNLRVAGIPLVESVIVTPAQHWLTGCPPQLRQLIEQAASQPGSIRFFQVLERVSTTRMYALAPAEVRTRMWRVASTVLQPAAEAEVFGLSNLREQLEHLAEEATNTCEDGIALVLSRFEATTLAWRAAANASGEGEQVFEPLVRLSDRLFRMDLVDEVGMRITRARTARLALRDSGVPVQQLPALDALDDISEQALAHGVDEVEVRLFLLEELRVPLDLPQPATAMRYETVVSSTTVSRVATQVATRATRSAMGSWLIEQISWRPYLERFYAQQFGDLQARWALGLELFETAISADEILDVDAVMPPEVLAVLEQTEPQVAWMADGLLQHVELAEGRVLEVYQALSAGRERHLLALRLRLTNALLGRFSRLPQ
jgi:Leucine-rich repeat (LRR) protein